MSRAIPFGAYLWSALLTALTAPCQAQSVGKLRLMVDPGSNFEFVLDRKYRMQQREVELTTGGHHFSFWAPQRKVVDTTLIVLEGMTRDVVLRLPYSDEYRAYQQALVDDRKKMWTHVALPAAVTTTAAILTYGALRRYKIAHDKLVADEEAYRLSADPEAIRILKEERIPRHKEEFADRRTLFLVTAGIFTAVAAGSAWVIHKHTKRPLPMFHDREKVKFDGLVWLPERSGNGFWFAGIHLDLH